MSTKQSPRKWRYHSKNGITWLRHGISPYSIQLDLSGGKHKVFDVRMYSSGGSTNYKLVKETRSIEVARNTIRTMEREDRREEKRCPCIYEDEIYHEISICSKCNDTGYLP